MMLMLVMLVMLLVLLHILASTLLVIRVRLVMLVMLLVLMLVLMLCWLESTGGHHLWSRLVAGVVVVPVALIFIIGSKLGVDKIQGQGRLIANAFNLGLFQA
jgi:hypothetical protein